MSRDATHLHETAHRGNVPRTHLGLLSWKESVRVATTASVAIATALNAGDTIDGVTLAAGDRVLVAVQATGSQNGIYIAGASPARAPDFDESDEVMGALVYVREGTANAGRIYRNTNTSAPTIGTTAITFVAVGLTPVGTAVGDLLVWNGTAWTLLPAGSNTHVLTRDSGETLGVKWAAGGGGGGDDEFTTDGAVARLASGLSYIGQEDGSVTDALIELLNNGFMTLIVTEGITLGPNSQSPGGSNDAKVFINGGQGLVLVSLSADPAGGASENGQIYYNDTTHKFRGRANGAWVDLN